MHTKVGVLSYAELARGGISSMPSTLAAPGLTLSSLLERDRRRFACFEPKRVSLEGSFEVEGLASIQLCFDRTHFCSLTRGI